MSPLRIEPPEIEAYVEAHTTPPDDLMLELQTETRGLPRAGMLSGNVEGRLLETLAFVTGARLAVDIGTFTGNSALSIAAGMGDDGRVITCDVNEETLQIARRYFAESPYADRIEVRVGPALDTIADIDGLIDLAFIDADKTNYVNYYEAIVPKLAKRGLIAADNTLWSGQVLDTADASDDTVAIRAFNDHVRSDPRVVCVQLTVRDGVTLIRRR
jgi:caffeoyl-CoA O-methyltransferase